MRKRKVKHTDVAAYVLGVLDPTETYAFEEHLLGCWRCGQQVAEFTSVKGALAHADPRYMYPGDGQVATRKSSCVLLHRCGRLPMIAAKLAVLVMACIVAALMTSSRSSDRYRRVRSDANTMSPAPLHDDLVDDCDQRLLPLPTSFK
jgi:anti-sigma factor RsiW